MHNGIDPLLDYFRLLRVMLAAEKTDAAIIHCLGLVTERTAFRDNCHAPFPTSPGTGTMS